MTTAKDDLPRVLIVDDDLMVRMLLQEICAERGWSVAVAATKSDALLAAGLRRPDPALVDFNLADDNALGLLGDLQIVCPGIPIVVVTGQAPQDVRDAVIRAGGRRVVGKPCSVAEVAVLLRESRTEASCKSPASLGRLGRVARRTHVRPTGREGEVTHMTPATARVYRYRGHHIEVNAYNTAGRWNAEIVVCGPLTDDKPQREIVGSYVSAGLAERAARECAQRWVDLNEHQPQNVGLRTLRS